MISYASILSGTQEHEMWCQSASPRNLIIWICNDPWCQCFNMYVVDTVHKLNCMFFYMIWYWSNLVWKCDEVGVFLIKLRIHTDNLAFVFSIWWSTILVEYVCVCVSNIETEWGEKVLCARLDSSSRRILLQRLLLFCYLIHWLRWNNSLLFFSPTKQYNWGTELYRERERVVSALAQEMEVRC